MIFNSRETFQFDGREIRLEKMKSFDFTSRFVDYCLPLVVGHLRPLEVVISAMINQYAPNQEWGLLDNLAASEKEINHAVLPAFKLMVDYYLKERTYSNEHLDSLIPDIETLYEIVYSQMQLERVLQYHLRRKLTFMNDIAMFTGLDFGITTLMSKAEEAIKQRIMRHDPDVEFAGVNGAGTKS